MSDIAVWAEAENEWTYGKLKAFASSLINSTMQHTTWMYYYNMYDVNALDCASQNV